MSFTVEARKARSDVLSTGSRVRALAHCIELYSPIGFQATWAFLEQQVGQVRSDAASLIAAVQLLEESRLVRLEEERRYAARRITEKRRGQRQPRPGSTTPQRPSRWHADPVAAAAFAYAWHRDRHKATGWSGDAVEHAVLEHLDGAAAGTVASVEGAVAEALRLLSPRSGREHFESDPSAHFAAHRLRVLADHVRVMHGLY